MIASNHLRVFEAVAREGSIGGAAHELGCTQPTVSHHLASLEKQLGTTLFVRGRRGVELTDRGRVLLDHAELILTQLAAAERAVEDSTLLRDGSLRIGTFATAGATFLPALLTEFHQEHPGIRMSVVEIEEPGDVVDRLRARRLDVGIVFTTPDYWVRPMPGVAIHRLFADPFRLVIPAGHPLAGRGAASVSDLATERWVTARSDEDPCAVLLQRTCRAAGFEPDLAFRIDDYAMVGSCVAAGLAVALVPQLAVQRLPEGLAVLDIAGDPLARDVHAIVLGDGSSVTATSFMRKLKRVGDAAPALSGQ